MWSQGRGRARASPWAFLVLDGNCIAAPGAPQQATVAFLRSVCCLAFQLRIQHKQKHGQPAEHRSDLKSRDDGQRSHDSPLGSGKRVVALTSRRRGLRAKSLSFPQVSPSHLLGRLGRQLRDYRCRGMASPWIPNAIRGPASMLPSQLGNVCLNPTIRVRERVTSDELYVFPKAHYCRSHLV